MPWGGGDDKGGFGHLFLLYPHVLEHVLGRQGQGRQGVATRWGRQGEGREAGEARVLLGREREGVGGVASGRVELGSGLS